jgi:type 2 lantibiotic biosynthesis protein LanM
MDGITEGELLELLGEPMQADADPSTPPPAWWAELAQALTRPAPANPTPVPLPEPLRGKEVAGFLAALAPLLARARDRLRAGVRDLLQTQPRPPFDPGTIEALLLRNLPGPLLVLVSRTLVLELRVARLGGLLQGETPAQRFQSFVQRLRRPEVALALFQDYPVLARQVMRYIDNWVRFSLSFLRHLCADWEAIRLAFSPGADPGVLVEVNGGVGDRHRGGRAVLLARFSSGFRVVYKPKALAVDAHFQELLRWLNARGDHPPFRTLTVLERGTYGWVEFVAAQGCTSAEEVGRFYERQGGYLALLYALEATDCHYENLIASGEHPVFIDLESFFHPRVEAMTAAQSDQLASQAMAYSVLRVGLLPQRFWANADSEGTDVSGLGGDEGQLTPRGVLSWKDAGTDEMRAVRERKRMPGAQNRPTLNGARVEVLDYAEAIVRGFTSVYGLLLERREELLSDDGPLARFARDEVRVILRPTRVYGVLLHESFHPDVLRDALERDHLFDRLWVAVVHRPYLADVIAAERADLLNGDVPLFTTRPASRDLWTSTGERLADFLGEPGMSLVQRRLRQLSAQDLKRQLWYIRAALTTLSRGMEPAPRPAPALTEPKAPADRQRLLAAARAVGEHLEELAVCGEPDASWVGLMLDAQHRWTLAPMGWDLYEGLPGVALFLAYLGAVTGEARHTRLAQSALTALRRQATTGRSSIASIGGFDGWGGILYTLTHLGVLWDDPALLGEAEQVVDILPPLIERDERLDVIGGAAGCIGSLLSLHHCAPSERTLAAARQCGDRLLARAQPVGPGIAWTKGEAGGRPLAGFSHGAAGMAWALGELAARTGEGRFRTAARAAIAYERSLFSPAAGNWPDLRDPVVLGRTAADGQESFVTAWCHGAPGIGLGRLRLLRHSGDAQMRAEVEVALRTTLAQGFGRSHSLCHGDLGNLELLVQAAEVLEDPRWQAEVPRLAAIILESIEREGCRCGNPLGVESPGLMTGLAGIGYGLLRLAEPARVPAILVLAPPARSHPPGPTGTRVTVAGEVGPAKATPTEAR